MDIIIRKQSIEFLVQEKFRHGNVNRRPNQTGKFFMRKVDAYFSTMLLEKGFIPEPFLKNLVNYPIYALDTEGELLPEIEKNKNELVAFGQTLIKKSKPGKVRAQVIENPATFPKLLETLKTGVGYKLPTVEGVP